MEEVMILGGAKPVRFQVGVNGTPLDEAVLLEGLRGAAQLIDSVADWTEDERAAFEALRGILFFSGAIEVNGWTLSRPGCDEDDAIFYWEVGEFMKNTDADVRANTLFHDCWHIVQYQRAGDFARTDDERVEREVDAIDRQIRVARRLGCSDGEIAHLRKYLAEDDHALIVARLRQGVRMDHDPIDRGLA